MGKTILTDTCCWEGCDEPRRKAGGGRSRFCYTHHHVYYTASNPEAMKRKRDNERARQKRIREGK